VFWGIINATLSPRITAQNSYKTQAYSPQRSAALNRSESIEGTARVIPAHLPIQRGDNFSITHEKCQSAVARHQSKCETDHSHGANTRVDSSHAWDNSTKLARPASGKARTTTSNPTGEASINVLASDRSRRLTRFRATALPTFLETTHPKREAISGSVPLTLTTKNGVARRRPLRWVKRNSSPVTIRCARANTGTRSRRKAWCGPCGDEPQG